MDSDIPLGTDSLKLELIAPPLTGVADVCPVCCDWSDSPPTCTKCKGVEDAFGLHPTPVIPITLYSKPSVVRDILTFYKDQRGPDDVGLPAVVAALFERFFATHGKALAERYGKADAAVVVPGKGDRPPPHPLLVALRDLPAHSIPPLEDGLALGAGQIDRRAPRKDGYTVISEVAGKSIVLLDDVYTTGATAQSAAYALRAAGANVTAIVVAGRRLNPGWSPHVAGIVERQRALGFDFDRSPWEG